MMIMKTKKEKMKEKENHSFTAYIIRGNRQVHEREVKATKRFMVNGETYIIKPSCIFLKMIDNELKSVSYYREGNPNPYDFISTNIGISNKNLDRLFAEDFFHIVSNLQVKRKDLYLIVLVVLNFALLLGMVMMEFLGGLMS